MNVREMEWETVTWIELAQDWIQWRVFVSTVPYQRNNTKFLDQIHKARCWSAEPQDLL
jgi:hypothetical protein